EIRQHRRPPARGLPDRFRRPIDPWTVEIGARGDKALGPADLDHRKAAGAQMRPHTVDHGVEFGADHKAKLQHGTRLSGNSVGGLVDIARRYRQYLQRVPGVEPLSRRQAVLAPIVRELRLVGRWFDLDVGKHAADLVGEPRRLQLIEQQPPMAVDQRRNRVGENSRGIGKDAAPIAGMVPAVAQIDVEMDAQSAAAAEKNSGALRREPRAIGGEKQIGLQFIAKQRAKDRKSTRLNSSHSQISYAVFCLKKKKKKNTT